jgi:hypothetical protein
LADALAAKAINKAFHKMVVNPSTHFYFHEPQLFRQCRYPCSFLDHIPHKQLAWLLRNTHPFTNWMFVPVSLNAMSYRYSFPACENQVTISIAKRALFPLLHHIVRELSTLGEANASIKQFFTILAEQALRVSNIPILKYLFMEKGEPITAHLIHLGLSLGQIKALNFLFTIHNHRGTQLNKTITSFPHEQNLVSMFKSWNVGLVESFVQWHSCLLRDDYHRFNPYALFSIFHRGQHSQNKTLPRILQKLGLIEPCSGIDKYRPLKELVELKTILNIVDLCDRILPLTQYPWQAIVEYMKLWQIDPPQGFIRCLEVRGQVSVCFIPVIFMREQVG